MERNTTAYQLNILRDTQMVQRRFLEKQFPYIDWARMPFSSYGDFFRLRGILDDCGAVWTNGYKRSNDEAASMRKYLKDYSGNGRDIELFNFGYSRQSGYNGYVYGMKSFKIPEDVTGTKTESYISVTNTISSGGTHAAGYYNVPTELKQKSWKVFVEKDDDVNVKISWFSKDYSEFKNIPLTKGLNTIPGLTEEEASVYISMAIDIPHGKSVKITEIPKYPGAIVGDGVDDYGQCVKDFSLPDDYTVVAMRELIDHKAPLIAKSIKDGNMSFIFEHTDGCYSYGSKLETTNFPKLFSYMTKTSYNGNNITPGSTEDLESIKLRIFSDQGNTIYDSSALYSFGIFTRTLTEEELRIVENCMYAEWIAMTGKLEDIEYYDILDARFRSNEEDADKRNRWVGRLGKLHLTLNNYAYSVMSGWNGYPTDWKFWNNNVIPQQGGTVEATPTIIKVKNFGAQPTWTITSNSNIDSIPEMRIKIRGLKTGATLLFVKQVSSSRTNLMTAIEDGIYTTPADSSAPDYYAIYCNGYSANEEADLTIELIPDYGGALVSDGVDDNAISDETIDEEIGGFVCHADLIGGSYCFFSGPGFNTAYPNSIGMRSDMSGLIHLGQPEKSEQPNSNGIYAFSKTPLAPERSLSIDRAVSEYGAWALYQLRLIKTQPTETQLEAIKWQCRKEHDDYLIHMGWKEVE